MFDIRQICDKMVFSIQGERRNIVRYITGTIQYIGPEYIVLENNGIGYQIITPNPYKFKNDGTIQKVYTYLYVREDALTLYGFLTATEKSFFLKTIECIRNRSQGRTCHIVCRYS